MPKCDICGEELEHQEHCGTPKMILEIMDKSLQIAYAEKSPVVESIHVKKAIHELYCPKGRLHV